MSDAFPLFPLGSVVLPSALVPLRVFEPRYLALLDAIEATQEFGSVLIERGHEVGGGDVRMSIGCVAQVLAQERRGDYVELVAVGTRRFSVEQWLEDDPYPQAAIQELPEPAAQVEDTAAKMALEAQWIELDRERRSLGAGALTSLDDLAQDPALFSFQLAAVAPIGPLDKYRVLAAEGVGERLAILATLLGEQIDDARQSRRLQ